MNANNPEKKMNDDTWGRRDQLIFATFLQGISWFLSLAIYSYLTHIPPILTFPLTAIEGKSNWMGKIGWHIAHYLVNDLCGINAFFIPLLPFWLSFCLAFKKKMYTLFKGTFTLLFFTGWSTIVMGYLYYTQDSHQLPWYLFPGKYGEELTRTLSDLLGAGVMLLLVSSLISILILLNVPLLHLKRPQKKRKSPIPLKPKQTSNHQEMQEKTTPTTLANNPIPENTNQEKPAPLPS